MFVVVVLTFLCSFDGSEQSKLLGHTYKGPFPAVAITHRKDRYVLPSLEAMELSAPVLKKFVDSFLAGKLHRPRSQPIPSAEDNEGKRVKRIVADNFEDVIFNPIRDVAVIFYQSGCSYCQDLMPVFAGAAKRLPYVETLVFGEFDQTFNDVPEFTEVRMYPTIALFSLNSKEKPLMYTGNKTVEDLVKFIHDNVGAKFDIDEDYGEVDDDDDDDANNNSNNGENGEDRKEEL